MAEHNNAIELWRTDGTLAGTRTVTSFNSLSGVTNVCVVNGRLVFVATDPATGTELFVSDGTSAGTRLLADLRAGPSSSYPRELTPVEGGAFLTVRGFSNNTELWFTDGTAAGTVQLPANLLPFDEEEAWSYELGVKSTLLDRRLILNAALFRTDWKSVQVDSQFIPPPPAVGTVGYTSNAGKAEIEGFELEARWQATERLSLSAGYAYTPARIFDFLGTQLVLRPPLTPRRRESMWRPQYELLLAVQRSPANRHPNPKFQLDQLTTACVALCRTHEDDGTLVLRQARLNTAERVARERRARAG